MFRQSAGWVADREGVPTAVRAVCGYYADTGVFDYGSLSLRRRVESVLEEMIADAFAAVEEAIAAAFDRESVEFDYGTKLLMPAELTLGYLYRRLDEADHDRAEAVTRLVVEALLDGDMRDAINDDEFEDFEVDFDVDEDGMRRVAEVAQATLEERVQSAFAEYPDAVQEAYDWAVDVSESHQDDDPYFRDLMAAAQNGTEAETPTLQGDTTRERARERIREDYKFADFADPPAVFDDEELDLPYVRTQYDRVGVIYSGMVEMYREAGLPIEEAFERSIVLAIVGAQIWLDDVDDYADDLREGQLTPVTAEYLLADDDVDAADAVVDIAERYLDIAKAEASTVDSTLTGIATEYIYRSGDPGELPR